MPHFYIRNPVLTFGFSQISHFDIRYPILSFSFCRISHFDIRNHILTFELGHFDIRSLLILYSNWGRLSHYDIPFILKGVDGTYVWVNLVT